MKKIEKIKNKNEKRFIFAQSLRFFRNNHVNKMVAIGITLLFILSIGNAIGISLLNTRSVYRDTEWEVTLTFTETSGKNDYVIFGEALDASDGLDSYDIPNPPGGVPPFIDAYFTTDLPWPHDTLLQEIKTYPDTYKQWNFSVFWTGSDTTVTISWDTDEVDDSEYFSVALCDDTGAFLADMFNEDAYLFFCNAGSLLQFQIICRTNQIPTANDDTYNTDEDTTLNVVAPGVLENDVDDDGPEALTAFLDGDVNHGNLTFNIDGSFEYTPDSNWSGIDYFTYHAYDGAGNSNIAIVAITVDPVNDDPIANDDNVSVEQHSSNNQIDVLNNDYDVDGDALEVINVTIPDHGTASYDEDYVYYTPEDGYFGADLFTYTITDNNGSTGISATVDMTVIENEPPEKPDKPSGETRGTVGVEYTYTTSTTDINDDQIFYYFSWGDDTASGWIGPYESGELAGASHSWEDKGNYEIKVKAKDGHGLESEWSDPLPISMPLLNSFIKQNKFITFLLSVLDQFSSRILITVSFALKTFKPSSSPASLVKQPLLFTGQNTSRFHFLLA